MTRSVLVFDDDPALARYVLRKFHHETALAAFLAENAAQAISLLEDDRVGIDAVLSDIAIIPEKRDAARSIRDGLDLLRFAKEVRPGIRLYVLSIFTGPEDRLKADNLKLSMDGWFQKLEFGAQSSDAPWTVIEKNLLGANKVSKKTAPFLYDIFLAHNSQDKAAVMKLAQSLTHNGIEPWVDDTHIAPGTLFQDEIERGLKLTRALGICIGPTGIGPWQRLEVRAAISQFVGRGAPVIPILLSSDAKIDRLPLFLKEFRYVQLSEDVPLSTSLQQIIWGIGQKL